ncbi:hypothetical protein GGR56DRAFT_526085 [Xylariaceae sp. FL0804]|nr:hypothetical protein GGR56DRAFT_526085 [Xylariaceae sp. FL0804]
MEEDETARSDLKENVAPSNHPRTPPDDSSIGETTRLERDDSHVDSVTEELQVRAHLQDVESSFMPGSPTHLAPATVGGVDDTYLFDAAAQKLPDSPATEADIPETHSASNSTPTSTTTPKPSPPRETNGAPALPGSPILPELQPDGSDLFDDASNSTLALENMSSSPTAAVAARAISRARSAASNGNNYYNTAQHDDEQESADLSAQDSSSIPPSNEDSFSAIAPTSHHQSSHLDSSRGLSNDAGSMPGDSLRIGMRPKYLRSRNASQRSSSSSFLANDDADSDVTVGIDADQPPPAARLAPAFGLTRGMSNSLSRTISMGSMASGVDDESEPAQLDPLEPLEEVDSPVADRHSDNLATPRAQKGPIHAPTDTVIARHVRNIQVPESLAREYKTKGGLATPMPTSHKFADNTPAPTTAKRSGKNMTLKEQQSTIERLHKENFDLKLKVMFLSQRLDKLSEEGVKEMISENVELRTLAAVTQRENKLLRRRAKELEKRLRDEGDRPSTARSGFSSDEPATPAFDRDAQEREEELTYLREQIEVYATEVEKLRAENMSNQVDKRKLAETLKTMGSRAGERASVSLERQEEADVWKDLLEQETARLEQADEEARRLREENFRLKQEMNGSAPVGGGGMHHTTNIYNITRKAKPTSPSRSRPVSGLSGDTEQGPSLSQSSTLLEELRHESEQLRHENAELRREVGAQTSMLTSRNREKERLYQEIEDLKLAQRRGGPVPSTIDSLLDRSASRVGGHERSVSRGSGRTRLTTTAEDPDYEELENKVAEQRDKINELKFKNQELQRELETSITDFEEAMEARRQSEEQVAALQEDLENASNDLVAIQAERDEALQEHSDMENEFESLRREAQEEIDALEAESDQKSEEVQRLQLDLHDRSENFEALQEEMRSMSEALVRLEDDQENKLRRIEQLEQELNESNRELEELESKLLEANEKAQRLGVQQESSQGEIAFLREEQEGDKIRIGDLEAALANAEQSIRDEREQAKELEKRLTNERKQREMVADREKEEVQQFVNELNREASTAKDEARTLRKSLSSREVEAAKWKERLMELENNLREALGDLNGTRSSLLKSIAKLQRELENTVRELDNSKSSMLEKDRLIKQRDSLLETHGLESRRLAEMLDKERQAHRTTRNQFETFERTHQHVSRTVTNQDSRIVELESSRSTDKKRIAQLETAFKEQLVERNNLLLVLWTRLSSLCGSDWAHNNSLINGRALPSLESISTMLPGFAKNLLAAVKTIEAMVGNFQSRVKAVERDLWKEYQSLENGLEVRTKKLERLETIVRSGVASGTYSHDAQAKLAQLESAYRALKVENATLQRASDARARSSAGFFDRPGSNDSRENVGNGGGGGSPSPAVPMGPHGRESKIPRSKTTSHLETNTTTTRSSSSRTRTTSRSASNAGAGAPHHPPDPETPQQRLGTSSNNSNSNSQVAAPAATSHSNKEAAADLDKRYVLRLRELEWKLKQEREARNIDRAAARQRIHDSERQNGELTAELVRVRRRGGGAGAGAGVE